MSFTLVHRSSPTTIPPPRSAHLIPAFRANSSLALMPMAKQIVEQSIFSPSSKTTPFTWLSSVTSILPTRLLSKTSKPKSLTCVTTKPPASPSNCRLRTQRFLSISLTFSNAFKSIIAFAASSPSSPPPTTTPQVPFRSAENSISLCKSSIVR